MLAEQHRQKLDNVILRMQEQNEPEENIRFVVDDFKKIYEQPEQPKPEMPITEAPVKPKREKGLGYFGALKRPDGGVSTELSIGTEFDGKEMEIPALVPTLTQEEIDHLLQHDKPTETIFKKAVDHAKMRMKQGKDPFAQEGEQIGEVAPKPAKEPTITDYLSKYGGRDLAKEVIGSFARTGAKAAEGFNRGLGHFAANLDKLANFVSEKTGFDVNIFEAAKNEYMKNAEYWESKVPDPSFLEEVQGEFLGGAGPGMAEFMLSVPYAAALGYTEEGLKGAAKKGFERLMLGKILHASNILKRGARVPAVGGVFGTQAAVEGAEPREIAKAVGVGAGFGMMGGPGEVSAREVIRGVRPKVERIPAKVAEPPKEPEIPTEKVVPEVVEVKKLKQDIKVYRASDKPFDKALATEEGVFVTPDKEAAEAYSERGRRKVQELYIDKNAKILKFEDTPKELYVKDGKDYVPRDAGDGIEIAKYAREHGYDAVEYYAPEILKPEISVVNPEVLTLAKKPP
ncbi:MAG: hypothetical protein KAS04_03045, partial [Candidatus Aenigmarchaeota archaeon]|nr:hypothetical protein [Candidatus Aenigmarchaeota archaeon]